MRPYQRLPVPFPCDYDPGPSYFYDNFASHFIPDMIKMVDTGLKVDPEAVESLRTLIDEVQETVYERLGKNQYVISYQEKWRRPKAQKEHEEDAVKSVRTLDHYLKPFKQTDMTHRTWLVNTHLQAIGRENDVRDKWTVKDVKEYNTFLSDALLANIIDKRIHENNSTAVKAMKALAEYKLELWNRPRYEKKKQKVKLGAFNPNSSKQVSEIMQMLKIPAKAYSKDTGEPSWGREQLEQLHKETQDETLIQMLDAMIDNSFSAIIKTNFIKAFDTFTIDGVLHGKISLFGAKSFRNTSNSPNLLNAPSTGSIYAKPLKKCFTAPENMLVIQCDFSSLEDVVLANLSGDEGKIAILTDPTLDSHCYNAMGYFPDEVSKIIGGEGTFKEKVRRFKIGVDEGNLELKELRQKSKPHTFGLAYGKFPDEHKGGAITQKIFDNYHDVLYPGVTRFREGYVLKTARSQGYIHLGLGCRIYTDNADNDIRTLNNSCSQFWSVLTLIAVNELNCRIEESGLEDKIKICATIYDSIYAYIVKDPDVIKWYNDNVYEIGKKDFLERQPVSNTLTCGIGRNWAEEISIPVNASSLEIREILETFIDSCGGVV